MRHLLASFLAAIVLTSPAHAGGDVTAFMGIQQECVKLGDVSFGPGERWAKCEVTRGRWTTTIGLIDMYATQYCLSGNEGACERRALSLFANRAYTGTAHLLLQRIDPAGTEYDDPFVVKNEYGYILTLTARFANGLRSDQYYRWQGGLWQPIDTHSWLKEVARRLPAGVRAGPTGVVDLDAMATDVDLYRDGPACCSRAGVARVELKLANNRLVLKKLVVAKAGG